MKSWQDRCVEIIEFLKTFNPEIDYNIPFEANGKKYGMNVMYGQGSSWVVYTEKEFLEMKIRMAELETQEED